ncbi:hypothetical protein GW17_00033474 [Ensete ventricosum]|nr:hypothetical protein GW17_00033474 [Ensete ventricosum]
MGKVACAQTLKRPSSLGLSTCASCGCDHSTDPMPWMVLDKMPVLYTHPCSVVNSEPDTDRVDKIADGQLNRTREKEQGGGIGLLLTPLQYLMFSSVISRFSVLIDVFCRMMKTQDRIFAAMESPAIACLHDLFRRTMPDSECGKSTRRTLPSVQPDAWTTRHAPLMNSGPLQSHFTPCSSRGNLFRVHAKEEP